MHSNYDGYGDRTKAVEGGVVLHESRSALGTRTKMPLTPTPKTDRFHIPVAKRSEERREDGVGLSQAIVAV